ncbi:MAG TPA: acetylglutamate kinase [Thermoanaerobaculia bacterium]|jgi:acetylglutamate kinase|nr:acetylglutamate kinase [Thermoanaerobaculia bacterium]
MNVIKLGGSLLDDPVRRAEALSAIAAQWKKGDEIVLVHGGGKHVDANLKRLGIPKRTYAGLRVTDDETLDVVVATLAGSVNKMLVAELAAIGVRSAGVSGCDASTLSAELHPPIDGVDLGHVGSVIGGDPTLLRAIVSYGILPVVSSVAEGPNGTLLNVNADSAAAAIAVSLGAEELIFITDVAGLLDESGNVVAELHAEEAEALLGTEVVSGGMRPKLQAALHALGSGVRRITIGEEGGTNLVAA